MADYWNKKISIHHLYYALAICILCAICILVVLCSSRISDEAFQNFSFASTVVSIVLAVVSILFSIWTSRGINDSFGNLRGLKTDLQDEMSKISEVSLMEKKIDSDIDVYVGHDSINVTRLMKEAKHYIFLHAAYYPKYGVDEQGEILKEVLENNPKFKLKAIFSSSSADWTDEFAKILRPHFSKEAYIKALNHSKLLFEQLHETYGKRVQIIETELLPMFPILMIDNDLIVGFYSHSRIAAPYGLWIKIRNKKVISMYETLAVNGDDNANISDFTNEEKAIFRFVEEIYNGQKRGLFFEKI